MGKSYIPWQWHSRGYHGSGTHSRGWTEEFNVCICKSNHYSLEINKSYTYHSIDFLEDNVTHSLYLWIFPRYSCWIYVMGLSQ